MEQLKDMPFVKKSPVFRMLAEIGDLRKLSPEDREKYDEDIKNMRDLYATRKFELEQQERMLKEAVEKAAEKAEKRGEAKGSTKKGLSIAKNLLLMGMSDEQVLQATGITSEQLATLKN